MTRTALTFSIALVFLLLVEPSSPGSADLEDPASRFDAKLESKIEAAMAEWLTRHKVLVPERSRLAGSPPASPSIEIANFPIDPISPRPPAEAVGGRTTDMFCQLPPGSEVLHCRIVPVSDRTSRLR